MESMFINRVKKNYANLSKWAKRENITAYRIYDKDIPQYPYTIDFYAGNIVLYKYETPNYQIEFAEKDAEKLKLSLLELIAFFGIDENKIFLKSRKKQKGLSQYEKQDSKKVTEIVTEKNMNFLINLSDYLDCGLFLDHRKSRQMIRSMSKDLSILNLFAYTGSVSVAAALGGAKKVTTIDMSNTYIQWAIENFKLNNIDISKHQFIRANVLQWLTEISEEKIYDFIFLDPPSFSNSKKMFESFDVQQDHLFLLKQCSKMLKLNGQIFFSNNLKSFKLDEENLKNFFHIENVTKKTIPLDFRNEKIHQAWILKKLGI
ncbi:class I SAM-dependent methyltransferase [Pigmentibacter sp. JX0631]|uniref:class I SAM-dependent methyltransferase n=1 Tax=Pigmentibacter sp. JX0631 TaxID=2976982 RepID=UPI0024696D5E|nr:class I SAM-dependent methyltransferase [Pigmentibacter sp. JX0631]WGL58708.1 class I SAM-dependent methyltransferase [Pigmentibacter sp. JX0631]